MPALDRKTLVYSYFESYQTADRGAIEALLSDDFTFTSPYDDHIDRAAYFTRCWSQAGGAVLHDLRLVTVEGDDALVHYDSLSPEGQPRRNIERFHFDGDRISSIEVYFGRANGTNPRESHEAIRTVLEQRREALQLKDARLVAAKFAPNPVVFSLAPPLVTDDESEGALAAWFKTWDGLIEWQTHDPRIVASEDVAYVTALENMAGKKTDGEAVNLWFRTTLGLRQIHGEWKITHEHQSVPFYMDGSFRAAVDLIPSVSATPLKPSIDAASTPMH